MFLNSNTGGFSNISQTERESRNDSASENIEIEDLYSQAYSTATISTRANGTSETIGG
jgi:hypothetical protein